MLLEGKVALVTGAGAGIGFATAERLVLEGARVVLADIDDEAGARAATTIDPSGERARFVHADITDPDSVAETVRFVLSTFGRFDLAVNNAGIHEKPAVIHEQAIDAWRSVIELNLTGTWLCLRAELEHFSTHGGGAIVNLSSGSGLKAAPRASAYAASKHGIVGLTRTAAMEYVEQGIRVNAVAPGAIESPALRRFGEAQLNSWASAMPMKRMGTPDEVAAAIAWLLSDEASYCTGAVFEIDGGFMQA